MEDKEEQPEKAPSAIVVTDSGKTTVRRLRLGLRQAHHHMQPAHEHHRKDSLKIFHF